MFRKIKGSGPRCAHMGAQGGGSGGDIRKGRAHWIKNE